MKNIFVTKLRDKKTNIKEFREAAYALTSLLASQAADHIKITSEPITTPLAETKGEKFGQRIILAPILRSGITMVPPFMTFFPNAPIAVIGIRRDEKTAEPQHYYTNIPPLKKNDAILILDPMLATGGTLTTTIQLFLDLGVPEKNIIFIGIVSSPEGIATIKERYPKITLVIAAEDDHLNDKKFIIPGLGDYGDRFFGTQ